MSARPKRRFALGSSSDDTGYDSTDSGTGDSAYYPRVSGRPYVPSVQKGPIKPLAPLPTLTAQPQVPTSPVGQPQVPTSPVGQPPASSSPASQFVQQHSWAAPLIAGVTGAGAASKAGPVGAGIAGGISALAAYFLARHKQQQAASGATTSSGTDNGTGDPGSDVSMSDSLSGDDSVSDSGSDLVDLSGDAEGSAHGGRIRKAKGGSMAGFRMPRARRFQVGGVAGGLGAAQPGVAGSAALTPAAAMPAAGLPGAAVPPAVPSAMPPAMPQAIPAAPARFPTPGMMSPSLGAPGGVAPQIPSQFGAAAAPGVAAPAGLPALQAAAMRRRPGMARGGRVKKAGGGEAALDGDNLAKKRRPDRQWGETGESAEGLAPKPIKKAKGGVMRKRPMAPKVAIAVVPKKAPVPTPPPEEDEGAMPPSGMATGGKWIQGAIKKPGALHKQLGVPMGKKIPAKKLAAASKKGGKLAQRANLAKTLGKMNKAKGGKCDKMAAGGAAKQRKGFPNTSAPPKRLASGGKVRGCGVAERGCKFSGVY